MSIFVSHAVTDTEDFGASFTERLRAGDVIALFGGLGMGKTAFVRGMARGLQTTSEVSSPTFALVHEYDGRLPIAHFDMYRIHSLDDLYSAGFFDYLDAGNVLVIEICDFPTDHLSESVHVLSYLFLTTISSLGRKVLSAFSILSISIGLEI